MKILHLVTSLFVVANCVGTQAASARQRKCKCFPGDPCWPSQGEWDKLNATVGGRLIKTVPLGSPCHDPHYNAALCETLKSQWKLAPVQ